LDKKRNFGLDIIRCIAILAVVFGHGKPLLVPQNSMAFNIHTFFEIDGVTIFFVLSGFLIGGILLKIVNEPEFSSKTLWHFWIRRWFRTLPNYYLILLILIFYNIFMGIELPDKLPRFFYFFQNINGKQPDLFGISWSLSVEEWFYILIPLFLFFLLHSKVPTKKTIQLTIVLVIVGSIVMRFLKIHFLQISTIPEWDAQIRRSVITRLDSIMFGFWGAYLLYYKSPLWSKFQNLFFFTGMLLILGPNIHYMLTGEGFNMFITNHFLITATTIGTLMILPKLYSLETVDFRGASIITGISLISYSIYLVHFEIVKAIILPYLMNMINLPITEGNGIIVRLVRYSLYWILTILFSFGLYTYFEKPMTHLRDRFSRDSS
jgi:peptidoglycan/LPS O-acetylase OafA/YrhL